MNRTAALLIGLLLTFCPPAAAGQKMPSELAGFRLGEDIADAANRVDMETRLPIRYAPYLSEVETRQLPGYKTGLITYGGCAYPGKILRIKMKYADHSKKFYQQLLKHFKDRFGEPSEWRGDPFQVVLAWKWSFADKEGNRVSLILQHNTQDEEQKKGNSVKMTLTRHMEEEEACHEKAAGAVQSPQHRGRKAGKPDWEQLVPR
jgi:hypothetical protein